MQRSGWMIIACLLHGLKSHIDIFKEKKEQVMFYIQNFTLPDQDNRKQVTKYLEIFLRS